MRKLISVFVLLFIGQISFGQSIQDAKRLTDNEQYEEASEMYRGLINAKPNDATLYYYYGDNLLSSDNPDSAKIIFDKGKTIDPQNSFLKIGEAKLLLSVYNIVQERDASQKDGNNPETKIRFETATQNL